jgi:hypothetical protein
MAGRNPGVKTPLISQQPQRGQVTASPSTRSEADYCCCGIFYCPQSEAEKQRTAVYDQFRSLNGYAPQQKDEPDWHYSRRQALQLYHTM